MYTHSTQLGEIARQRHEESLDRNARVRLVRREGPGRSALAGRVAGAVTRLAAVLRPARVPRALEPTPQR